MSDVNIQIELELGYCNGYMNVLLLVNDKEIQKIKNNTPSALHFNFNVEWPAVLQFQLKGKNKKSDTVMDYNGTILENKYVKLKKFIVNGISLLNSNLYQISFFKNNNEIFWDDNGIAIIKLTHKNPLRWLLFNNNTIYFRESK